MTYFPITKLDEDYESTMAEKQDDGSVIEVPIITKLYRCDGLLPSNDQPCNLVWTRASQALGCANRGHRASYRDGYRDQSFIRKAVRRDGPTRPTTFSPPRQEVSQAPALSLADALKALSPDDFKAIAAAMGLRVSKAPKAKEAKDSAKEVLGLTDEDFAF